MSARVARLPGLDAARGAAVLLMLQTHSYDAWVRGDARASFAFAVTRWLGTLPLPMFLLLAGMSAAARVRKAVERAEAPVALRRALRRNAFEVLGWAYALNFAYALLDGSRGLDTVLRADVLHAIGLSLLALSFAARAGTLSSFVRGAWWLAVLPVLASPLLTPLGGAAHGLARYVLAPFVEVPGLSPMPFIPLAAFTGLGALLGARHEEPAAGRALAGMFATGVLFACLGALGCTLLVGRGVTQSRAHPIIVLNAIELAGRAALVLALVFGLVQRFVRGPGALARALSALIALGQNSLLVYGLHLPFCYGRFGQPIKRALGIPGATMMLAALVLGCGLTVAARERIRRSKNRASALSYSP